MQYAPTFVPTVDAHPISGDINRGAVTTSITPHWRRQPTMWGHDTPPPPTTAARLQPRRLDGNGDIDTKSPEEIVLGAQGAVTYSPTFAVPSA